MKSREHGDENSALHVKPTNLQNLSDFEAGGINGVHKKNLINLDVNLFDQKREQSPRSKLCAENNKITSLVKMRKGSPPPSMTLLINVKIALKDVK